MSVGHEGARPYPILPCSLLYDAGVSGAAMKTTWIRMGLSSTSGAA